MEEEEKVNEDSMNPDALEAALGDDFVEVEEEELLVITGDEDDDDLDIAFPHDDPRDWY